MAAPQDPHGVPAAAGQDGGGRALRGGSEGTEAAAVAPTPVPSMSRSPVAAGEQGEGRDVPWKAAPPSEINEINTDPGRRSGRFFSAGAAAHPLPHRQLPPLHHSCARDRAGTGPEWVLGPPWGLLGPHPAHGMGGLHTLSLLLKPPDPELPSMANVGGGYGAKPVPAMMSPPPLQEPCLRMGEMGVGGWVGCTPFPAGAGPTAHSSLAPQEGTPAGSWLFWGSQGTGDG